MYGILILTFLASALVGCSGNPTAVRGGEIANKKLNDSRSPVRVEVKVLDGGGAVMSEIWAGKKGTSIIESADEVLKNDIFNAYQKCGFEASALKEIRVVRHKHPFYYEVWVFNDPQSRRTDKTTGISLVLTFPKEGGTDINLNGNCRA